MNYEEPEVKSAMFEIADFWLEEVGVDGFRLDAVKYIFEDGDNLEDVPATFSFFKDFRDHYKETRPDAFTVGEAWTNTDQVRMYSEDGGLDFCFEFDLAGSILNAVNRRNTSDLSDQLQKVYNVYPHLQFATFLTNHDQNRLMDAVGNDQKKVKTAAAVYLLGPGVPFLYYGEEIGMNGQKPDENIRRPMQWSDEPNGGFTTGTPWHALNTNFSTFNVESESNDPNSILNWYRKLISIRNAEQGLQEGNFLSIPSDRREILSFIRQYRDETYLVVINTSNSPVADFSLDIGLSSIMPDAYAAQELINNAAEIVTVTSGRSIELSLEAHQTSIYKFLSVSGVNERKIDEDIFVFPNPVSDKLFLSLKKENLRTSSYYMTDMMGRVVGEGELHFSPEGRAEVNTNYLPSGTFYLYFFDHESLRTTRFVKF